MEEAGVKQHISVCVCVCGGGWLKGCVEFSGKNDSYSR